MSWKLNLVLKRVIGIVMVALGALVLARLYILHLPPRLGSQMIDTIFGAFFILRGAMNLKRRAAPGANVGP